MSGDSVGSLPPELEDSAYYAEGAYSRHAFLGCDGELELLLATMSSQDKRDFDACEAAAKYPLRHPTRAPTGAEIAAMCASGVTCTSPIALLDSFAALYYWCALRGVVDARYDIVQPFARACTRVSWSSQYTDPPGIARPRVAPEPTRGVETATSSPTQAPARIPTTPGATTSAQPPPAASRKPSVRRDASSSSAIDPTSASSDASQSMAHNTTSTSREASQDGSSSDAWTALIALALLTKRQRQATKRVQDGDTQHHTTGTPHTAYATTTSPSSSDQAERARSTDALTATSGSAGSSGSGSSSLMREALFQALFVPPESLRDVRLIGSGGFAVVYLVEHTQRNGNRLLAAKRLVQHSHAHAQSTRAKTQAFLAEIRLVATLQHPRIVRLVGAAWTTPADVQALFEYMAGGDLRTFLDANAVSAWDATKRQIALDVIDALAHVHALSPPLVHRDVKARNVLLASTASDAGSLRAKLSDFGVSRHESSRASMTTGVGTGRWLAPEVIHGGGAYDASCDVYSFGVLLSELDTHCVPFADARAPDTRDESHIGDESGDGMRTALPLSELAVLHRVATGTAQLTFSATCPPALLRLARLCLAFDRHERPSAAQVATRLRAWTATQQDAPPNTMAS